MNILIFDTETTNLQKPFCYNIGYIIYDTDEKVIKVSKDFVVEQIWHNKELFSTAYYVDKRPIYVNRMRAKKTIMKKFGQITKEMINDIKYFNVISAYAYNSPFDDKVFTFNCEWFNCMNPFDNIPIFDIRGYVMNKLAFTIEYQAFCDTNQLYTDTGNYSTTAENVYRYITKKIDFEEEHTALSDSEIELQILEYCINNGAIYNENYKVYRTVPRNTEKTLTIYPYDAVPITFKYKQKTVKDNGNSIWLKN